MLKGHDPPEIALRFILLVLLSGVLALFLFFPISLNIIVTLRLYA